MTQSHPVSRVLACFAGIGLLLTVTSCAPTQSASFRSNFLPPAPRSAPEEPDSPPALPDPAVSPNTFLKDLKEIPNLLPVEAPVARGSEMDNRLKRAEESFEAGKRLYQDGKLEEARQAFNRAVDLLLTAPDHAPDRSKLERRLDTMVDAIYRFDVIGLGAGEDSDKVVYDKSPLDGILEMTFPIDPRLKPKVKEEVTATASQIPLDESDSVLSYIHFFSSERGKRILVAGLRRAGRYRPLIERVLSEEGVPQELIYLAQAESGFLPRAVSYKKAAGMWQFLSWRGKEYGLAVTPWADDRLDPEKATRAAAQHLRDLYNQFGDWYLAMAAYNCGPGCVDRAVQRTGYADFWTLRDLNVLPKQTQNYVPAILAITIMAKNPKDYGLDDVEPEEPVSYDVVKMEAPTNLMLVADALERPVAEIRDLNPSLLKGTAPSGYELRVPKGSSQNLIAVLDMISPERRATSRVHRVERGETLADIARRYHTAASAIASANPGSITDPEEGDWLLIPASYAEGSTKVRASSKSRTVSRASSRTRTVKRASSSKQLSSSVLHKKARTRHVRTASTGRRAGAQ
jgi:membrane-bound lytic murein transglycosylase D